MNTDVCFHIVQFNGSDGVCLKCGLTYDQILNEETTLIPPDESGSISSDSDLPAR